MDHQILHTYNQTHYQEEASDSLDQEILDLYELTTPVDLEEVNVDDAWSKFSSSVSEKTVPTKVVFWQPLMKVAAAVIVALGIGLYTYDFIGQETTTDQVAMIEVISEGSRQNVTLPDGTEVWMNKGSMLMYPASFGDQRDVQFEGEGFFEVAKDGKRFIITTPQTQIEVLGTAFNLNTDSKRHTKVTVTEGIVSFTANEQETKVTAGQEGVFTKDSKTIALNQNPDVNAMSWKTGHFIFKNTELSKVITYLNGYYSQEIKIEEKMSSCKVTGTFDKLPLKEVLQEISIILSAEITNKGESFLISGEGC
jgi:transmembrane sensor